MSTYTSVTMPFTEAIGAFNALTPHMSRDNTAQIITGLHFTADGHLVATDRYTVGRYKPQSVTFTGDEFSGATIPAGAVKWLAAMRPLKLAMGKHEAHNYVFRFTFDSSTQGVRIELGWGADFVTAKQSARFGTIDHTDHRGYPNVMRLFPDEATEFALTANALSLKTEFLARVGVAVKWLGGPSDTARFQFTKADNPAKPGPVYVSVNDGPLGKFDCLIQPNLLVR